MTFVPVVPGAETPASPNTQQLAARLSDTLGEFLRTHPETSPEEIRQALRLAAAGFTSSVRLGFVALALGLLVAAGMVVFLIAERGSFDPGQPTLPMVLVALAVLALVGVMVALKR